MKRMAVTALMLATVLFAEMTPEQEAIMKARQAQMLKNIQAELGLSDAQTAKWAEIQERYMKQHQELRIKQNTEINAILNEAQQKKFEIMQQNFRKRLNQRIGGAQQP